MESTCRTLSRSRLTRDDGGAPAFRPLRAAPALLRDGQTLRGIDVVKHMYQKDRSMFSPPEDVELNAPLCVLLRAALASTALRARRTDSQAAPLATLRRCRAQQVLSALAAHVRAAAGPGRSCPDAAAATWRALLSELERADAALRASQVVRACGPGTARS